MPILRTEVLPNETERSQTKENEIDMDSKRIVCYDVYG